MLYFNTLQWIVALNKRFKLLAGETKNRSNLCVLCVREHTYCVFLSVVTEEASSVFKSSKILDSVSPSVFWYY